MNRISVAHRFRRLMNRSLSACLLFGIASFSTGAMAEKPPDILLIVADDMGWMDFGFMGSDVVHTPNLDRLAKESAVFPNGYVPSSLCRASLATLLTGLYAHQHHICCNDPPKGVDRSAMHPFIRHAPAIPRLLAAHGYVSLQTGKFWEGHYVNAGFTEGMTTEGRHGEKGLEIGRKTLEPIRDFMAHHHDEPFFIWYAPMLPHEPHNPPERLLKKYQATDRPEPLAKYYAMCEWFDETCGEVLSDLDKAGLADTTLVIFVVDNGWIQSTKPHPSGHGRFDPRSKRSPYDGGIRTPILFRWPGKIAPGRFDDLVSTIDLAPTILAAAGVSQPSSMQGMDLLPLLEEHRPLGRDAIFGEIFSHDCVELAKPSVNLTHRWIRKGDWKLIVPAGSDSKPELFDITHDPHEKTDEAGAHPEKVAELTKAINEWWDGT